MGLETEGGDQLEAGYSAEPTETQVKADEPAKVEPEPAAAVAEPAADPLKEIMARLDKFEKGHTTLAGNFGQLRVDQKAMQERLEAAQSAASKANAPTPSQVNEAIKNPEKWEALKADYSEWGEAIEEYTEAKLARLQPQITPEELSRIVAEQVKGETQAVRTEIIDNALDAVFPGWRDETRTEEFKAWKSKQTEEVQALAASDKIADAARMLRLYEQHKAKPKPVPKPDADTTRQRRLAAAVTPKGSGGIATSTTDQDEFEAGYGG